MYRSVSSKLSDLHATCMIRDEFNIHHLIRRKTENNIYFKVENLLGRVGIFRHVVCCQLTVSVKIKLDVTNLKNL